MKVRQLSVCNSCRLRKLGCDGKIPACSQCLLRSRDCPGYDTDLIFLAPLVSASSQKKHRSKKGPNDRPKSKQLIKAAREFASRQPDPERLITWPLPDILSLCVQNLVPATNMFLPASASASQICCSWIEALPQLLPVKNDDVLASSMIALGTSIVASGNDGCAPTRSALEAQSSALRTMRSALLCTDSGDYEKLAAASMCLLLTEMLLFTSQQSSTIYLRGMSDLIQHRSPGFFTKGVAHTLFVGFRSLIILNAIASQTATFLSDSKWMSEPFKLYPAGPFQMLMTEGSEIPAILEKIRRSSGETPQRRHSIARKASIDLARVVNRLRQWLELVQSSSRRSMWWQDANLSGDIRLGFPNVATAVCLNHYLALWIICVSRIRRLRLEDAYLLDQEILINGQAPEENAVTEAIIQSAVWILQSFEFFVQEKMKVFGIAEYALPFSIASRVLAGSVPPYAEKTKETVGRLSRGKHPHILTLWSHGEIL